MDQKIRRLPGKPLPFGVSEVEKGFNFSLFAKSPTQVFLEIFQPNHQAPLCRLELDPVKNRTGDVWHIHLIGLQSDFFYAYKLNGPLKPEKGFVYDATKPILDPYAKAIVGLEDWGATRKDLLACHVNSDFDWEDDQPLNIPLNDSIIYEIHVRGFTQNANSDVIFPGTFRGITEKIPYFLDLGITAVELMPIHEFDESDCPFTNPTTGEKLLNLWGYNSIGFFAIKTSYSAEKTRRAVINEFKYLVKALHKAGIEVILDVVFNHTAEGGEKGSVYNFKGIENSVYYILDDKGGYKNFSGCGNTMNCNHPVVRKMILDALHYWVIEMHVDGFRFDLASIMGRDENGHILPHPPILESIAKDPVLSKTKIIAEAWDAVGLYQVGSFPASKRWAEWNGKYRDIIRRFCSGEAGIINEVATRISGNEDLYKHSERNPYHSINFITAHDGFTMYDLVSYQKKKNLENGENNQDGNDFNFSMNFGCEGETEDLNILELRKKQIRNMATLLFLSQGTPMLLGGDEFGRTQKGNNNAWCQDNETSWVDWDLLKKNTELFRFWQRLIQFRKEHAMLRRNDFFTGKTNAFSKLADISWHSVDANKPEFNSQTKALAFLIDGMKGSQILDDMIYVAMNFEEKGLLFELPEAQTIPQWEIVLNTEKPKNFILSKTQSVPKDISQVFVDSFSIVVCTRSY
ncbi:MAG: glycogen debranching protein GlgX [Deltaproteobacteria bacterium]|nr:glycogen debranching protein GlgX [Deltaproteobacteria bacterium]